MNTILFGLLSAAVLGAVATIAGLILPVRVANVAVGLATAGLGVAVAVAAVAALGGQSAEVHLPWLLPGFGLDLHVDAMSGLFMAVIGVIAAATAIYGIGYASGEHHRPGRATLAVTAGFVLSMAMVPAASSVASLLVAWELMAVCSLVLILADHRGRPAVASAGRWYAAMTQLGFVAILLGLLIAAAGAGGGTFAQIREANLSATTRGLVFVLILIGFGSKAGLVPLHVWLPRAHPEAPSPTSAMLSAAMVNLGVYGVVRVGFDLLGGGTRWWWLLVLLLGGISAVYGILHATVDSDLKRLLAYSTVENMGLIFLGVGAAGLLRCAGAQPTAAVAMTAAMLHVVNHAGFKALLFCAAGSVQRATGTRDLDELGGLRTRMPVTTAMFAFGALAAAALPPANGFVSEWLLLQALVHSPPAGSVVTTVAMPVAVAVVALTAGLAVATMVKAVGTGFFARPHGDAVRGSVESPRIMLAAMATLAAGCLATAVAPTALGPALGRVLAVATGTEARVLTPGVSVRLRDLSGTLAPLWIMVVLLGCIAATAAIARLSTRGRPRRTAAPLWDCGVGQPTPRMQYTATAFAQPLQRVFDTALASSTDTEVTADPRSKYLLRRVAYSTTVTDGVERRGYVPLLLAVRRLARLGSVVANGSLHRYLSYGFVGVTGLLLVLAVLR